MTGVYMRHISDSRKGLDIPRVRAPEGIGPPWPPQCFYNNQKLISAPAVRQSCKNMGLSLYQQLS
ncbi:hypothetical protein LQE92_03690 [Lacrimispora sp. NSJ-141]|uniref:Uncharacterized protein n=1 Tax=Lientehia hominis TaxID=2897778 RepID=A0AAP2W862_9FIRM|nr:hypothetical protein [Lientehia hominis]MCD2491726.1 hypothetical protein [Lientehia hominis]